MGRQAVKILIFFRYHVLPGICNLLTWLLNIQMNQIALVIFEIYLF